MDGLMLPHLFFDRRGAESWGKVFLVAWLLPLTMSKTLEKVGEVSHYFTKISVAVVELTAPLRTGDRISIKGMTTDFEQAVESMEIEHEPVEKAEGGDSIGLKVADRVREGDIVYKLVA